MVTHKYVIKIFSMNTLLTV